MSRPGKAAALMLWLAIQAAAADAWADVSALDDSGNTITLAAPAKRVVTLAPHAAELVFAAGAGSAVVGRTSYSDYPPAAQRIALIGDSRQIDLERVMALKPDLIVAWQHGNNPRQLEQLRALGIPMFYSEPRRLAEIPETIERLGILLGSTGAARAESARLRQELLQLRSQYAARPPVRVFYQIWDQPLYTLNGAHIVSDALRLCGGENIFAGLPALAPGVDREAVLRANPEAILGGQERAQRGGGVNVWKAYPGLLAVRRGNLFAIDSDLTSRPGPRLVEGARLICEKLELARSRREVKP